MERNVKDTCTSPAPSSPVCRCRSLLSSLNSANEFIRQYREKGVNISTYDLSHVGAKKMASDLEQRLRSHSDYFESLFSLVPAQYRTAREDDDERKAVGGKETRFWHLKKGAGRPLAKKRSAENAKERADSASSREEAGFSVDDKKSLSLSELRRRLHEKIKEVSLSKKEDRESDEGERKKRKRRRGEGAAGLDKKQLRLEEKKKRKEATRNDREVKQKKTAVEVSQNGADKSSDGPQFSFNRFEFSDSVKSESKKKNYKALIAKAEAKQRKLQEMAVEDVEKGEAASEKERWSKAVRMARGEKVRDDPSLLRKTVKKLEKKKQSHAKKWKERVMAEQEKLDTRQKKRQQNIRERIDKIKAKKTRRRAKKRGLV